MTAQPTYPQRVIRSILDQVGVTDVDPRHIEAAMRLQYSTLDHLSRTDFHREVAIGIQMCAVDADAMERLAQSYGL